MNQVVVLCSTMYEFVYRLPVVFAKLSACQLYDKCNNSIVYILYVIVQHITPSI